MDKDYYKILGVDKKATKDDIKKAFHKLAHKYHPDKKTGDEKQFKEVNEAYGVLSNEKKRAEYDAYGRVFSGNTGASSGFDGFDFSDFASQFQGGQGFEFDLGDIFGDFFGGNGRKARRGRDISVDLQISFKDSVFGVERKILITKSSTCETCNGTGAKEGAGVVTCTKCNGAGKIHESKRSLLGVVSTTRTCDACGGSGTIPKEKCQSCHGEGVVRKETEISVAIPAGINNGEMIRLSGYGEAIRNGQAGDLYIKVHVEQHHLFEKVGADLHTKLQVKLSDALLGATYTIDSLEGPLSVSIPAGVSSGEVLRIKDKGVPTRNGRGHLLVTISVPLPKKLSKKAKEAIETLRGEGI